MSTYLGFIHTTGFLLRAFDLKFTFPSLDWKAETQIDLFISLYWTFFFFLQIRLLTNQNSSLEIIMSLSNVPALKIVRR